MSKEMISIPEGNLLSVAASKGIPNLTALKEKTGVDRKTLRAINTGKPAKKTKLQSIADSLRLPIEHLLASNAADKNDDVSGDEWQYREIKLQRLDGPALRQLATETDERNWFLNIDPLSEELEAALLRLRKTLDDWFRGAREGFSDPDEVDNLVDVISHIKISADIDKSVAELTKHKLKVFGGRYITWEKEWGVNQYGNHFLEYRSHLKAALNITPEDKTNSTVRVCIGWVPPRNVESELARIESRIGRIDQVEIDCHVVWSRPKEITFQGGQDEDDFLETAKRVGLLDENGIPR